MIKKLGLTIFVLILALFVVGLVVGNMSAIKANIPLVLIVVAIAAVVAVKAVGILPKFHHGLIFRLQEPTGRVLSEGPFLKIPFIDKVEKYPFKVQPMNIIVDVLSKDKLKILIKGLVEWAPSKLRLLIFAVMEETILDGLNASVESELGKISGGKNGDAFIEKREALEKIINCVLRLKRMPHLHVNYSQGQNVMGNSFRHWIEQVLSKLSEDDCHVFFEHGKRELREKLNQEWHFPAMEDDSEELDVIEFYRKNAAKIQLMLDLGEKVKEISPIEKKYGISIAGFRIKKPEFSPETQQALEKDRQKKAEMKAADEVIDKKIEVMAKLDAAGLKDPEKASNAADVLIGAAEKRKVFSIEGGGALPLLNLNEKKEG